MAITDQQKQQTAELRAEGTPWQTIAKRLGVPTSTLRYNCDPPFREKMKAKQRQINAAKKSQRPSRAKPKPKPKAEPAREVDPAKRRRDRARAVPLELAARIEERVQRRLAADAE